MMIPQKLDGYASIIEIEITEQKQIYGALSMMEKAITTSFLFFVYMEQ
jgi:hypothetical protein